MKRGNKVEKPGEAASQRRGICKTAGGGRKPRWFGKINIRKEWGYLTIVARAEHGGYMQHTDYEGKAIYSKTELLSRIRTALGGRAAEIVYYGKEDGISTGAGNDFTAATDLAQQRLLDLLWSIPNQQRLAC